MHSPLGFCGYPADSVILLATAHPFSVAPHRHGLACTEGLSRASDALSKACAQDVRQDGMCTQKQQHEVRDLVKRARYVSLDLRGDSVAPDGARGSSGGGLRGRPESILVDFHRVECCGL